jgi:uncharacterized protein (DUF1810 family)
MKKVISGEQTGADIYDLKRFIGAQEQDYQKALSELKNGRKDSHWIWYIFPQIEGLASSSIAQHYAIKSIAEADAYLRHPVLGRRLIECAQVLLAVDTLPIREIMGSPDDLKLKSAMTLFELTDNSIAVFSQVLEKYYGGTRDDKTLSLVGM